MQEQKNVLVRWLTASTPAALARRWAIWILFIIVWTTLLLIPVPPDIAGNLSPEEKFGVAKSLHVAAYAFFAILTGWLPVPARLRWLLSYFLVVHGTATEFTQFYVHRGSSVDDVALDALGILIGCLISWQWWTRIEA